MYDDPPISDIELKPYEDEKPPSLNERATDPVKYLKAKEQRARERAITIETVRLLRQDVIHCFRKEGVNHFENCREVSSTYFKYISELD